MYQERRKLSVLAAASAVVVIVSGLTWLGLGAPPGAGRAD